MFVCLTLGEYACRFSEGSYFRRFKIQKVRNYVGSLLRRFVIPKVRISKNETGFVIPKNETGLVIPKMKKGS